MAISKIVKQNLSDMIFQQMKEQILNGDWEPGKKIPSENELTKLFGVSRISVRQALQKLTAIGLIETRVGEGSFVKKLSPGIVMNNLIPVLYLGPDSLKEVLEFRKVIEGRVAELACSKAGPEDIENLEKIYCNMEKYKDNLERFSQEDYNFHIALGTITNNSIIIQLYTIIQEQLNAAFQKIVTVRGNKAGLYYHRLILDAMKEKDCEKAKKMMDEHMEDLFCAFCKG